MGEETGAKPKKSVESLLGEHSNLVNLDSLVKVLLKHSQLRQLS